jgi:hypothetical protein
VSRESRSKGKPKAKTKTKSSSKGKAKLMRRGDTGADGLPLTPAGSAPFGEAFFSRVLPGMVTGCPCPHDGHEPIVRLHLVDGTISELAQIVALADRYGVFAVFEGEGQDGIERTQDDVGLEALPYELVARVTVRPELLRGRKLGFQLPEGTPPRVAALAARPAAAGDAAADRG